MGICLSTTKPNQENKKKVITNTNITTKVNLKDSQLIHIQSFSQLKQLEEDKINKSINNWKNRISSIKKMEKRSPKVTKKNNMTDKSGINSFIQDIDFDLDELNIGKLNYDYADEEEFDNQEPLKGQILDLDNSNNFKVKSTSYVINQNRNNSINFKNQINKTSLTYNFIATKKDTSLNTTIHFSRDFIIRKHNMINFAMSYSTVNALFNEDYIRKDPYNRYNIKNIIKESNNSDNTNKNSNIQIQSKNKSISNQNTNALVNRTFTEFNSSIANFRSSKNIDNISDINGSNTNTVMINYANRKFTTFEINHSVNYLACKLNSNSNIPNISKVNNLFLINADKLNELKNTITNDINNQGHPLSKEYSQSLLSKEIIIKKSNMYLNVKQGSLHNCSLISAIVSILHYNYRIKDDFSSLESIIIRINSNTYGIRIMFNHNAYYLITDDCFKYNYESYSKFNSVDKDLIENIWLNLLEKSISSLYIDDNIKEMQSNPSVEVYHLLGWIPETLELSTIYDMFEFSWKSLKLNFDEGRIILSIGTKSINSTEIGSKIKSNHCYIILSVYDYDITNTNKVLLDIKDPWGDILKITFNDLVKYFFYLFISWNTEIYPFKTKFHGYFDNKLTQDYTNKAYNEDYSLEFNPQYLLRIPKHSKDFEMRLVLSRNIININSLNKDYRPKISFKLHSFEGNRIIIPVDALKTGSSQREICSEILTFEANDQTIDEYVLSILQLDNYSSQDFKNFTVEIYSFIPIEIIYLEPINYRLIDEKEDYWGVSPQVACGFSSDKFINNPIYLFTLQTNTQIQIKLETLVLSNIMLLLINKHTIIGQLRIEDINNSLNQGFFFNGFSYLECSLKPGEYSIIFVCEDEKSMLKYKLSLLEVNQYNNTSSIKLTKPVCSKLKLNETMRGEWNKRNWFFYDSLIKKSNWEYNL